MPPVVARVTPKNIDELAFRASFLLFKLERRPVVTLPRGLADHLEQRFPGRITFGVASRADFPEAGLPQLLRTALGPLRNGVGDGYYLLEGQWVVGHHGLDVRPANVSYETDRADHGRTPSGVPAGDAHVLRQLVAYFEPIIERRMRAAGTWDEPPPPRSRTHEPPPPRTPAPAPRRDEDAELYALLGVAPSATDEELKKAFREQMKLNHPDRVAHLSPALQKFAEQQVIAIKRAYDTLLARRSSS